MTLSLLIDEEGRDEGGIGLWEIDGEWSRLRFITFIVTDRGTKAEGAGVGGFAGA